MRIEDIEALIERAGGTAYLLGHSSGGCLALLAARALGATHVSGVAAYEAPWNDDPAAQSGVGALPRCVGRDACGGTSG